MILLNSPRPGKITAPLLILGAANDKAISPKEVEFTAKTYNTKSKIIKNMAHDMILEKGWQEIADIIISWLKEKTLGLVKTY